MRQKLQCKIFKEKNIQLHKMYNHESQYIKEQPKEKEDQRSGCLDFENRQ